MGEEAADLVEHLGVGRRVRPRGAADGRLVDDDGLVHVLQPLKAGVAAGEGVRPVQVALQGGGEDARDEGRLARTGHAGDGREEAKREVHVHGAQVVVRSALDAQVLAALGLRALGGDLDAAPSGEVIGGDRAFRGHHVVRWTVGHHHAALKARSGSEVAQPVGLAKGVLVVLDHHEGVAEVGKFAQRFEQSGVVALVQPDGGLVQDVHHAGQPGADLRGQADALAFAAGQRVRLAVQREVVQANAVEEAEPGFDFLEDLAADEEAALVEDLHAVRPVVGWSVAVVGAPRSNERQGLVHGGHGDLGEAQATHRHVPRGGVEFLAVAGRAIKVGHAGDQAGPRFLRRRLRVRLFEASNDALPRAVHLVDRTVVGLEMEVDHGGA